MQTLALSRENIPLSLLQQRCATYWMWYTQYYQYNHIFLWLNTKQHHWRTRRSGVVCRNITETRPMQQADMSNININLMFYFLSGVRTGLLPRGMKREVGCLQMLSRKQQRTVSCKRKKCLPLLLYPVSQVLLEKQSLLNPFSHVLGIRKQFRKRAGNSECFWKYCV